MLFFLPGRRFEVESAREARVCRARASAWCVCGRSWNRSVFSFAFRPTTERVSSPINCWLKGRQLWDTRSTEAEGGSEYPSKGEGEGVPSGPTPTCGGDHAHHECGGERKKRSGPNDMRDGKNLRKVETIPTNADSGCLTSATMHKERRAEQHYWKTWVEVNDTSKNWTDSTHKYHPRKGAERTNLPCKKILVRCLACSIFVKYVARKRAWQRRPLYVCRFL